MIHKKLLLVLCIDKIRTMKLLFLSVVLVCSFCQKSYSQSKGSTFSFIDRLGNKFIIESFIDYPVFMDSMFIKTELPKALIPDTLSTKSVFRVVRFKKIKARSIYDLKVAVSPIVLGTIEEFMKASGYSNYRIFLTKVSKHKYKILSIRYLSSDI